MPRCAENTSMPSRPGQPVLGVTGAIGGGKTTVARQFAQLGALVIDADALSREAMSHPQVISRIRQRWPDCVDEQGGIDRKALAGVVFREEAELAHLESIIHPYVSRRRHEMRASVAEDPAVPLIVEDCPLLFEKGIDGECDQTLVVTAPREIRLQRLAASRAWTEAELAEREKRQMPLDKKVKRADHVVNNDASEAECFAQVRGIFSLLTS